MTRMSIRSLSSMHVLVTRPKDVAATLSESLKKLGATVTLFPTIEICEPQDTQSLQLAVDTIDRFDFVIFISPSAVNKTAEHIDISKLTQQVISLGSATTIALEKQGCTVNIKPAGHDSESLLQHPLLQTQHINKKRFIIFKGEAGRSLLSETLTERGAEVFCANMYRRCIPSTYPVLNSQILNDINVILVSSGESLNNLVDMTEDKLILLSKTTLVPGNRCKDIAFNLGFKNIVVTENATNASYIDKLQAMALK